MRCETHVLVYSGQMMSVPKDNIQDTTALVTSLTNHQQWYRHVLASNTNMVLYNMGPVQLVIRHGDIYKFM